MTVEEVPDAWNAVSVQRGQYIRHATAWGDWWELVIGWGPDGRLITVDRDNRVRRYSDPTDRWEIIDPPASQPRHPLNFTAADRRTTR